MREPANHCVAVSDALVAEDVPRMATVGVSHAADVVSDVIGL